ncbi:MAG: peptidase C11 [Mediterranea sp.]|jgi:hypothetical protein|nr:peptidase C11 [Mediterranea sp.]
MKCKYLIAAWLCLSFLLVACRNNDEPTPTPRASRTVLVYMAADNSLSNFASDDLNEIKSGFGKLTNSDIHLLVYMDINSSNTAPRLIEIKQQNGQVVESVVRTYETNRNSVGVNETKEVLSDAFNAPQYQADSYGLVYWSHGEGWAIAPDQNTRWVGQDTGGNSNNKMNISDFTKILQSAPHLDFLLFDACFMASIEVAYELRSYTDYIIASPTEIPGPGAMYDKLVPALFTANTNVATTVAAGYYEPYAAIYTGGHPSNTNWVTGTSIVVIDTEKLNDLAATTRQLLAGHTANIPLLHQTFDYDKRTGTWHIGYYDLAGMMRSILTDDAAYAQWEIAYAAASPYWETTPKNYSAYGGIFSMEGANGISCYIPTGYQTTNDKAYPQCAWYAAAGLESLGF